MSAAFPIETQIREVDREIALRRQVYPRQISAGKMRPAEADLLTNRMLAVRETLVFVQRHEDEFRAFMAARKADQA